MPPNIHATTLLSQAQFDRDPACPFDDSERYLTTIEEANKENKTLDDKERAKQVWKSVLGGRNLSVSEGTEESSQIHRLLLRVRVLDDPNDHKNWLETFGGVLNNAPLDLVESIHEKAPHQFTARVADFNDNLMYAMQSERGLEHLGLSSGQLKDLLQAQEYLGSFLTTEGTIPQPPHVDYTWEILETYSPEDLKIGFFPLTPDGMFLQVWPRNDKAEEVQGQLIFIPFGKLLILPAHTIHGGGFRTTDAQKGPYGNLRFHLYVAKNEARLPEHQTNKYTEPNNKGMELSWRYTDSPVLEGLRSSFFV